MEQSVQVKRLKSTDVRTKSTVILGNYNNRSNSRRNGNSRGRNSFRGGNSRGNFNQSNSQNQSNENKNSLHKINVRGRGGKVVKRKVENRSQLNQAYVIEYLEEQNKQDEQVQTQGKRNGTESETEITFIADSGATEHIISKSFMSRDFKKNDCGSIRCANKNTQADIKIDAKGDLLFLPNNLSNTIFKLANVLATKDISENLLSLRKFVEAGMSVYLDDEVLEIRIKKTGELILEGVYESPNWKITFIILKRRNEKELDCTQRN